MTNELLFRLITAAVIVIAFSVSIYFRHQADRQGGKLVKSEGQRLLLPLRLLGLLALLPLFGYLINPAWVEWESTVRYGWPGHGDGHIGCD